MNSRSSLSIRGFCCLMLGLPLVFLVAFIEGMAGPLYGIGGLFAPGNTTPAGVYTEALINLLIEA